MIYPPPPRARKSYISFIQASSTALLAPCTGCTDRDLCKNKHSESSKFYRRIRRVRRQRHAGSTTDKHDTTADTRHTGASCGMRLPRQQRRASGTGQTFCRQRAHAQKKARESAAINDSSLRVLRQRHCASSRHQVRSFVCHSAVHLVIAPTACHAARSSASTSTTNTASGRQWARPCWPWGRWAPPERQQMLCYWVR